VNGIGAKPEAARPAETQLPAPQRSFVDIDPWAMLLEELMEIPHEAGRGRLKPSKGK
jgi:hypothetical protein